VAVRVFHIEILRTPRSCRQRPEHRYAVRDALLVECLDPIDAEPSSIANLNGVVGLAYIDGTVTRTRISTGETEELPFIGSDMRFMQGVYRGVDGKPRQGTFGFI
jgi:hypothetical protein